MTAAETYVPVLPLEVRVLADDETCPDLPIIQEDGRAWAVAWPGVGAHLRSMHRVSLQPDGSTIPLRHPMECVYYVIAGTAVATDLDLGEDHKLSTGSMILIEPGTRYAVRAGEDGTEIVGGPCPPDPGMYLHLNGGE